MYNNFLFAFAMHSIAEFQIGFYKNILIFKKRIETKIFKKKRFFL